MHTNEQTIQMHSDGAMQMSVRSFVFIVGLLEFYAGGSVIC